MALRESGQMYLEAIYVLLGKKDKIRIETSGGSFIDQLANPIRIYLIICIVLRFTTAKLLILTL